MKELFNIFRNNVLIKVASLNSFVILIRIVGGFLTSKAIAIFIGAEGMALVGNLRDFLNSIRAFSTLGFSNGIVKYISEFKNNTAELSKTISTSVYIGLLSTVLISVFCYVDAERLNDILFTDKGNYSYIIKLVAVALPFYSINAILLAILNGLSHFKKLLYINIVSQLLGIVITLFLIWQKQLMGALMAVATVESFILLVTLVGAYDKKYILEHICLKNINFRSFKSLGVYSIMALFTALVLPLVTVAIRNYIIQNESLADAGLWEAMNRISGYYLMFVSTLLTLYLLPRFSEIKTKKEFKKEVFSFYKTIVPIFAVGLIIIYFSRSFIIRLVFTSEFAEVENLFFWQLLGDFVKVLSIVIAYQFLAKRMVLHYLLVEAFSAVFIYASSVYFINKIGLEGAVVAHFVTYVVHFIVILIIFNKSLFSNKN